MFVSFRLLVVENEEACDGNGAPPGPTYSERAPSAPVPSIVNENWAGVDMMYHLDGRWRRRSLVYFGEPQDLVI